MGEFDCVRWPNLIEPNHSINFDWVRLSSINNTFDLVRVVTPGFFQHKTSVFQKGRRFKGGTALLFQFLPQIKLRGLTRGYEMGAIYFTLYRFTLQVACVAWRFCWAGRRSGVAAKFAREARENERRSREKNKNQVFASAPISSRFLCPRPPLLLSAPNQNRHATQATLQGVHDA